MGLSTLNARRLVETTLSYVHTVSYNTRLTHIYSTGFFKIYSIKTQYKTQCTGFLLGFHPPYLKPCDNPGFSSILKTQQKTSSLGFST